MPSYTKSTFIVFAKLPQLLKDTVDGIRKIYNPQGLARWEAHMTIKQDEDYSVDENALSEIVKRVLFNFKTLTYDLGEPAYKEIAPQRYMVYIPIHSPEIKEFVKTLSMAMEPFIHSQAEDAYKSTRWEQSEEFFLHCTISTSLQTMKEVEVLMGLMREALENIPKSYLLESLFLCHWEKDKWEGREVV